MGLYIQLTRVNLSRVNSKEYNNIRILLTPISVDFRTDPSVNYSTEGVSVQIVKLTLPQSISIEPEKMLHHQRSIVLNKVPPTEGGLTHNVSESVFNVPKITGSDIFVYNEDSVK